MLVSIDNFFSILCALIISIPLFVSQRNMKIISHYFLFFLDKI